MTPRRTLAVAAALVASALVAMVPALRHARATAVAALPSSAAGPSTREPWLKPHPRVVVAVGPADVAPPPQAADQSTVTYTDGPAATSLRPPSDAEVKRQLAELHVMGLGGSGGYVNPFAHVAGLTPERIDMGVDYAGSGPVVALGSGTVFNTSGGGWPGGVFIGITLDSGPYARRSYYIAEDVMPSVRVGQHVEAGQVIGSMYNGGSGIETGWAAGQGDEPLAAALSQESPGDPGGWSSAAGISFDRLLVSAGAPSGIPQPGGAHGRMPAGYP